RRHRRTGWSRQRCPHDPEAEHQTGNAADHRAADIKRREQVLMPLPQQHGVERVGREGRIATQHAGREEQPQMARRTTLFREPAGTALPVMRWGPRSTASARISPSRPAFDAETWQRLGVPPWVETPDMAT